MSGGPSEWQLLDVVRNPWGKVPLTGGGRWLPGRAQAYMDRLMSQAVAPDTPSRRHHYVPRSYLREWSTDGKRIWSLDTVTKAVKLLGIGDVCVAENFHRVVGPRGTAHNRVELMFGVVDAELRRLQVLLNGLEDPEALSFDDLLGLGASLAIQRMRTAQQRRLLLQHDAWLVAQNSNQFTSLDGGDTDPHRVAGIHTQLIFEAMWESADTLTTRQIEIWHDPKGRFLTCDAPVLVPFVRAARPGLINSQLVLWPISSHRVVALNNHLQGEKAVIKIADGKSVGLVRTAVEQGRERHIFGSKAQRGRLRSGKQYRRRPQVELRCSPRTPTGEVISPPGCCVEQRVVFSNGPEVKLCEQGLHRDAPEMNRLR